MLRFLTAGESHGPAQLAILTGIPAGLDLKVSDIQKDLNRRRGGLGRGERGKIENDKVKILSGVRFGKTLGSPIALFIENQDFKNWQKEMSIAPLEEKREISPLTTPRPGHGDLAGLLKYHFQDVRNVLERASARETVARVAVGAICRKFLAVFGVKIASQILAIGGENLSYFSPEKKQKILAELIAQAKKKKETLGGVIEITAENVPPGLGSYEQWDQRLDGLLAQALMSIPSAKAVEIGEGIKIASQPGSQVHDEIFYHQKKRQYFRHTNRAGGVEGGLSNGEKIVCRIYLKPLSSLPIPLQSVDIKTKKPTRAFRERSDICAVPRAGVIGEAMMAFVLAKAFREKFGGDSLFEVKSNFKRYCQNL